MDPTNVTKANSPPQELEKSPVGDPHIKQLPITFMLSSHKKSGFHIQTPYGCVLYNLQL